MDWTDLSIQVQLKDLGSASDIASVVANSGISIEDYSDLEEKTLEIAHIDLIDEDLLKKDRNIAIIHIYISPDENPQFTIDFLVGRFEEMNISYSISTKSIREEDWSTSWKTYYHPIELSNKLVICPSWEKFYPKKGQHVLYLDPGMAFGTGGHDTTRLCLLLMEKYLHTGNSMLDIGCGSGILALCAKLLGSSNTYGVDIDDVAVRTAKENAALNHIEDVTFISGNLSDKINGTFDIICANIVADAIILLSKDLPRLMSSSSICIVSGIIDTRMEEVVLNLKKQSLQIVELIQKDGWVAIACKKEL